MVSSTSMVGLPRESKIWRACTAFIASGLIGLVDSPGAAAQVPSRQKIMLRRDARLRKEYLYRKSLEDKEKGIFERKRRLKDSLDNDQPISGDLRGESAKLSRQLTYDENMEMPATHADDEYAKATMNDPKLMITTSRDPSSRLQQFAKEMRLVFPNSQRINRGNHVLPEIVAACRANEFSDLIILHEHRGIPDGMIICHFPYGPTAYYSLHNVVLRHDIPEASRDTVSEAYPHLIFSNFTSRLGSRMQSILKYLFPVPKENSHRVMTFANRDDFIAFRHHTFDRTTNHRLELTEIGPRFDMRPYEIKLGTVENAEADSEWAFRPYMNTSRKRSYL